MSSTTSTSAKRFDIALSFAGEQREFVRAVAETLATKFGRKRVFYDEWHEAELNGKNGDDVLQSFYGAQTELVVVFLSADYEVKSWPGGVEWDAIKASLRGRVKQNRNTLYLCRFDRVTAAGLFAETDIFTNSRGTAFPQGKSESAVAAPSPRSTPCSSETLRRKLPGSRHPPPASSCKCSVA